jgi:hypothetical protein
MDMLSPQADRNLSLHISPTDHAFAGKGHPKPDWCFNVGKMCSQPRRVARHRTVFFGG